MSLCEEARHLSSVYREISEGMYSDSKLAGDVWFIEDARILALPGDDRDSRYPYGWEGFNFWAYSSGYMHCNEGIFSPFLRSAEGQEPKICFFAGFPAEAGNRVVPLLPVPYSDDKALRFAVLDKSNALYITETDDIRSCVRVYVTPDREMRFSVSVENTGEVEKELLLSSYFNPYMLHDIFESNENRWFREVNVRENEYPGRDSLPSFVLRLSENLGRSKQVYNFGVINRTVRLEGGTAITEREETTSRNSYVGGVRSSLHCPKSLMRGTFGAKIHTTAFTESGICGDILKLKIPAGGCFREDILFSYKIHCDDPSPLNEMLLRKPSPVYFDAQLAEMIENEKIESEGLSFKFGGDATDRPGPDIMNKFFIHLKKQVEFCSLIKGYVQLGAGSLIGIRDVFQAIEGYLMWKPEKAKAKMLEALSFTDPSGRCPRQYALPAREGAVPAMDLRPFIDQGVWVISTIVNYLKFTGDFTFLDEMCGYHRIVDEKRRIVEKVSQEDSVLDHMIKIMRWLSDKTDPKTGCTRVLFGDWNDALDGLGVSNDPDKEYGSGVSVMAAAQVWQNLNEMKELLGFIGNEKYADLISEYSELASCIESGSRRFGIVSNEDGRQRITHGWGDELSYHVGGFNDPDGKSRISLTSNAFWVLSGLYDRDMSIHQTIVEDISSLDSKYGLRTFDPHFEPDAQKVGRINKLPAGTAENGAPYIHASVFGVMALFRMGESAEAWRYLEKALPFTHEYISVSPYVMPNSYAYNPGKNIDGQSMMDWQTGSSNVVLKLLVRFVAGIKPEYEGVWVQPAGYCPFEGFEFEISVKGKKIKLIYSRSEGRIRRFWINGKEFVGEYSPVLKIMRLWIPDEMLVENNTIVVEDCGWEIL